MPKTVALWHNIFKIAINAAVEEELLTRNRFKKVTFQLDESDEKVENFFTLNELDTFLDDAKQNEDIAYYTFLLTVAYTGMRRGEAMGLQWKNIDFKNNKITIERTRDIKGTRSPKTLNSYRTIVVDESIIKQLENYMKWCKKTLLSDGRKLKDDLSKEDTFVFISHSGDPIKTTWTAYIFRRILKRWNLPKVTLHGLRHTHTTVLLNHGVNVEVIAKRLGNTPQMIYSTYGHMFDESEKEAATVFSESLNTAGAKSGAGI